jgi:hypothetical protein
MRQSEIVDVGSPNWAILETECASSLDITSDVA